ncbi:MAG: PaaI family thioesterase [Rhodobacteraceae bacterium]|nr:PaaI family thioesterase [Paracoccaceae bacterium]MCY4142000.1 PaaI family thioesterase [Paracoccaceae bacterium]
MKSNKRPGFRPLNPDFEQNVRINFDRQGLMQTLSATVVSIKPGNVAIKAPVGKKVSQQDGFPHAGFGWSLGDSAAGFSALSLMAPGERVLTIEMKTNLLSPATGDVLVAEGRVIRFGRRVCTVAAEIYTELADDPDIKHVATMLGTMIRVPPEDRG